MGSTVSRTVPDLNRVVRSRLLDPLRSAAFAQAGVGRLRPSPGPQLVVRPAPSLNAVLGFGYAVVLAVSLIGSTQGWPDARLRGLAELCTATLWLAAFRLWSRSGDAASRRFWQVMGLSALSLAIYGMVAFVADLTRTPWLGGVAAVFVIASVPLLVASIAVRSSRQEGAHAGASTVLDVAIIVLSAAGLLGPSLIGPAIKSGDVRVITLAAIWLLTLFVLGGYLFLAYRIPADRSPRGLLLMSVMLMIFTIAGFAGAVGVGRGEPLGPWWVGAIYGAGVLVGLQAPRFDVRLEVPAAPVAASGLWGWTRMVLPYVAFVPLMLATLFAALAKPGTDITKSLAVTLVVVSALVTLRQMLQVIINRRLVAETTGLLKSSRANEAKIALLSRTKSEVMSNLSHEFRNALVGIQGFSELMRDQDLSAQEVKEFSTDIFNDASRLTRMINEMLDLDRMESGRVILDLKPLDLNVLVEDAVDRARVSGAQSAIVSQLYTPMPVVQGDTDRLFQVIANLVGNAVKYSPDGGEVLVTTSLLDGVVQVSVKDHGVGIAAEDLPRLFQRYERIDSKSSHKISGTGLGLVIARQIVEMHGGKIWAARIEAGGSEFAFGIPFIPIPVPKPDAKDTVPIAA